MASWADLKRLDGMREHLDNARAFLVAGHDIATYASTDALIAEARRLQADVAEHFHATAKASGIAHAPDPLEPPLWVNR